MFPPKIQKLMDEAHEEAELPYNTAMTETETEEQPQPAPPVVQAATSPVGPTAETSTQEDAPEGLSEPQELDLPFTAGLDLPGQPEEVDSAQATKPPAELKVEGERFEPEYRQEVPAATTVPPPAPLPQSNESLNADLSDLNNAIMSIGGSEDMGIGTDTDSGGEYTELDMPDDYKDDRLIGRMAEETEAIIMAREEVVAAEFRDELDDLMQRLDRRNSL